MQFVFESPDLKDVVISSHGMLPILETLETLPRVDITLRLLKVVNMVIVLL